MDFFIFYLLKTLFFLCAILKVRSTHARAVRDLVRQAWEAWSGVKHDLAAPGIACVGETSGVPSELKFSPHVHVTRGQPSTCQTHIGLLFSKIEVGCWITSDFRLLKTKSDVR